MPFCLAILGTLERSRVSPGAGFRFKGVSTLLNYPLPMVATRNHEFRKGHRLDRDRLLKEPVEQLALVPQRPAI